jgi:hypothetical protein
VSVENARMSGWWSIGSGVVWLRVVSVVSFRQSRMAGFTQETIGHSRLV